MTYVCFLYFHSKFAKVWSHWQVNVGLGFGYGLQLSMWGVITWTYSDQFTEAYVDEW